MPESADPTDDQGRTHPDSELEPPKPHRIASLSGALVIVFVVAIVVVPVFYAGHFPEEMGRWRLAAAWEQRLDGKLEAAIDSLNSALESDPGHVEIYLQRAAWYDEIGNREAALRDYNKVSELADNDRRMLLGRAMTYHRMGKPAESIRDLEQLLKATRDQNQLGRSSKARIAIAWNTLAYFRALNNSDLDQALLDIEVSLQLIGPSPALLDTRGYILYRLGEYEAARDDLEEAVKAFSLDLDRARRRLSGGKGVVDLRVYKLRLQAIQQTFAVLIYHRGLIYEKLGETDRAQADFDQVRDLGFEPGEDLY